MNKTVVDLACPSCGAGLDPAAKNCEYCGRVVVIRSFVSIAGASHFELSKLAAAAKKYGDEHPDDPEISQLRFTAAACHLRLKRYDDAIKRFEEGGGFLGGFGVVPLAVDADLLGLGEHVDEVCGGVAGVP